ncbi:MAG: ATPase P [Desulfatibacillaceae bacterium]|nr:ATPase P [Desulfatibacillaceae bacterium]
MLKISINGYGDLCLAHLVLDYNGTLACDGELLEGVLERLDSLKKDIAIHIVTADTFGGVATRFSKTPFNAHVLKPGSEDLAKQDFVNSLGPDTCVAIGNGANDCLMLQTCALGICVIGEEGACGKTLQMADLVVTDINNALDLLIHPKRLVATLRM